MTQSQPKAGLKDRIAKMAGPGKALLIAAPLALLALAVALLIIGRPANVDSLDSGGSAAGSSMTAQGIATSTAVQAAPSAQPDSSAAQNAASQTQPDESDASGSGASGQGGQAQADQADSTGQSGEADTSSDEDVTPAHPPLNPDSVTGIPYATRMKIARELLDAEQEAQKASEKRYPVSDRSPATARKREDVRSQLLDEASARIKAKYSLTDEQLIYIQIVDVATLE